MLGNLLIVLEHSIYRIRQEFRVGKFLNVLEIISYAHQCCIYLFKNTVKKAILYNIISNDFY